MFFLKGGPALAGQFDMMLGSVLGTSPGIGVDQQVLPLNLDQYLINSLTPNLYMHPSQGFLGPLGEAQAQMMIPPLGSSFLGLVVNHSFLTVDLFSGTVKSTSNPLAFQFVP
jgi:hypothetical protein